MQRILLTIILSLVLIVPCFAENGIHGNITPPEQPKSICPKTLMDNSCMQCHSTPDWSLIEKEPDANLNTPVGADMKIINQGKTAWLLIEDINSHSVEIFFDYVKWHPEITKCIMEIHSPGGSLFEGWRIVGMMEYWKSKGMIIQTEVHGMSMSAGFTIFVNGTKGYRFASPQSELMWHELYTFSMFKISRPSETEDEAVILRHLQSTASQFLSERSNLTAIEWKEKVYKKEFWINGQQAIKYGISDGYPK